MFRPVTQLYPCWRTNGGMSLVVEARPLEHRQPADPDPLLDRGVAREDAAVVEPDVAGDEGAVDQGAAVADPAVVADVAADHEQVAVADPGLAAPLRRSPGGR